MLTESAVNLRLFLQRSGFYTGFYYSHARSSAGTWNYSWACALCALSVVARARFADCLFPLQRRKWIF